MVIAVLLEPRRNNLANVPDLQAELPDLCEEHPSKDRAMAVDYGKALSELPLPVGARLMCVLSVEKHVDQQFRGERAGHEWPCVRGGLQMSMVIFEHPLYPLAKRVVSECLYKNWNNLRETGWIMITCHIEAAEDHDERSNFLVRDGSFENGIPCRG